MYWCSAPLRNKEERSYKVRDAMDVQVAPQPPIEEYIFDLLVQSDDDTPTTTMAPPKVATSALQRTQQATGKIPTSRASTTITATQTAEAQKKKQKRTRTTVSVDRGTVSSGVETINGGDEEDNAKSSGTTSTPSAGTPCRVASTEEHAMETPRRTSTAEEHPRSSMDAVGVLEPMGNEGSPEVLPAQPKVGDQVRHRSYTL
jgi:hypothetical protein